MSGKFELSAQTRAEIGKGASRRLRRLENRVPAIMYGGGKSPTAVTFNHFHVTKALESEAFYSHILTIDVDGKKEQAVLKDIQRHPFKPKILHMDFFRINPKEKINMLIPFHFTGGDIAPGVKDKGGIVAHLISSIEVRCLPGDLPEFINIDISGLDLDESIHLNQVQLPPKVELVTHGGHIAEAAVVKIHIPRVVEEAPAETTPATAEVPAIAQKATEATPDATKKEEKK